ncbi:MAG: glycosyltransferase family 9 protein [Planctomycetota bacterium]
MEVSKKPLRILITRLSAIGDTVLTLPVLTTLRNAIPDAFIAWAVESPANQFLELHPDLDEVIRIPKSWYKKPSNWLEMRKRLQTYRFDVSIDPQGITKSAMLGWLSGAPKRIGIQGKWGREITPWLNNHLVSTQSPHIVKRSVELLSALHIDQVDLEALKFDLPPCSKSCDSVAQKLDEIGIGQHYCMINPGGGWPSRQWEMERWGSVASYVYRHHHLKSLIVWAGPKERQMAERIHNFDPSASLISPATSLLELAVVAQRSQFVLSGDTGPLHIASAMGTPCIGLYGSTNPQESGAYGQNHIEIQKWHQTGSRKTADNDAMRDIMAADVFMACDQMVSRMSKQKVA